MFGDVWNYFPQDHAWSRAYRWGEDGLAGISDDQQRLCFALALWNGKDPILKERAFGVTNSEGNHGEDVKEYYFYGNSFTIECPTGSGKQMNLYEVAEEIGRRLARIFLKDEQGKRPVHGALKNSWTIPIGKIIPCSVSTSTGTPARGAAPATRPGGLGPSRASCISLRPWMRKRSWNRTRNNRWAAPPNRGINDDDSPPRTTTDSK